MERPEAPQHELAASSTSTYVVSFSARVAQRLLVEGGGAKTTMDGVRWWMLVGRWFQGSLTVTKAADSLFWQPARRQYSAPACLLLASYLPLQCPHSWCTSTTGEEEASANRQNHSLVFHLYLLYFTCIMVWSLTTKLVWRKKILKFCQQLLNKQKGTFHLYFMSRECKHCPNLIMCRFLSAFGEIRYPISDLS